jgi:hypothetical protein
MNSLICSEVNGPGGIDGSVLAIGSRGLTIAQMRIEAKPAASLGSLHVLPAALLN